MKFQISNFKFQISRGYTMVEMMIVIAVMAVIATIGFYGIRSAQENQKLDAAYREIITELRSSQNFVNSGGTVMPSPTPAPPIPVPVKMRIIAFSGSGYTVNDYTHNGSAFVQLTTRPVSLKGVTVNSVTICFYHPNTETFSVGLSCPAADSAPVIEVTNSNISQTKNVNVVVSGNRVTRIY